MNGSRSIGFFKGAPLFTSIGVLSGKPASMKDDLESVGYILIYLISGTLPWITKRGSKQALNHKKNEISDESDI